MCVPTCMLEEVKQSISIRVTSIGKLKDELAALSQRSCKRACNSHIPSFSRMWGLCAGHMQQKCTSALRNYRTKTKHDTNIFYEAEAREMAQGVNHLPGKCKDLSSNPRTHIKPGGWTYLYSVPRWKAETGEFWVPVGHMMYKTANNKELL